MKTIVFDPSHPQFPATPDLSQDERNQRVRHAARWLWARIQELEPDCTLVRLDLEQGIVEMTAAAMDSVTLSHRLEEEFKIYTQVTPEHTLRFTLSPGQPCEPLDTVQSALMQILHIV